ncbi:MAG: hypothetical protein ABIJ09_02175 [Pseudomonadota bacterium]
MKPADHAPPPDGGSGNRHVRIVFGVLTVVIVVVATARWMAVPATYGEYGHFRGAAREVVMNDPQPLHQGQDKCGECHDDEAAVHAKDVHGTVQCETCHGPGGAHVAAQSGDEAIRKDGPPIRKPDGALDCLTCHRRLVARPAGFPQIDQTEHFAMLHVNKPETPCKSCHSPHEPLFVDGTVAGARLHPVINECVDCHKHAQDPRAERPAAHPVVFECSYCHGAIARDQATRTHKDFRCGVCHQAYPVSERAARVLKHRDPRFCLLCHSGAEFKDDKAPPAIAWPQHKVDMVGEEAGDKVCVDCHREAFHLAPDALAKAGTGATP